MVDALNEVTGVGSNEVVLAAGDPVNRDDSSYSLEEIHISDETLSDIICAALIRQVERKASIYTHFYNMKHSRQSALNDLYGYWDNVSEESDYKGDFIRYSDLVFQNAFLFEACSVLDVPEKLGEKLYECLDLDDIRGHEIGLEEESM